MEPKTQQPTQVSSLTKELFSWKAPVRPFKKRGKDFYTTVAALALLSAIIFFTIEGFMPVLVIISLVFLVYVLSSIAPEEVEHKITNKGISFAGKNFLWQDMIRFWFTQRFGNDLLVIETQRVPGRLEMVINLQDKEKIAEILGKHINYEEAAPNFLDKAASWLSKKVPLEG